MADIQYRPCCYKCRADAGKEPAGVKPNKLCPSHLEAFALPLLDPTPITAEWLEAVGFDEDPQPDSLVCLYWEDDRGWLLSKGVHDQWFIYGYELPEEAWPKTRGDLRRLALALGITLKPGEVHG